jgi:hypothetical protein
MLGKATQWRVGQHGRYGRQVQRLTHAALPTSLKCVLPWTQLPLWHWHGDSPT